MKHFWAAGHNATTNRAGIPRILQEPDLPGDAAHTSPSRNIWRGTCPRHRSRAVTQRCGLSVVVPTTLGLVPFSSISTESESIVVSFRLQDGTGAWTGHLMPCDEFVLDIFVFNQSAWTHRFEVTFFGAEAEAARRYRRTRKSIQSFYERGNHGTIRIWDCAT